MKAFTKENVDTPDGVFRAESCKSRKTGCFETEKSKKVSKFPEKPSQNLLIFLCGSCII